ncbi:hypothetical protein BT69DRAFT_9855 [Atractiella rhizophila]|nr:hypothetical protein BT69DRAFT_9855 [Atractiella rhizophila]
MPPKSQLTRCLTCQFFGTSCTIATGQLVCDPCRKESRKCVRRSKDRNKDRGSEQEQFQLPSSKKYNSSLELLREVRKKVKRKTVEHRRSSAKDGASPRDQILQYPGRSSLDSRLGLRCRMNTLAEHLLSVSSIILGGDGGWIGPSNRETDWTAYFEHSLDSSTMERQQFGQLKKLRLAVCLAVGASYTSHSEILQSASWSSIPQITETEKAVDLRGAGRARQPSVRRLEEDCITLACSTSSPLLTPSEESLSTISTILSMFPQGEPNSMKYLLNLGIIHLKTLMGKASSKDEKKRLSMMYSEVFMDADNKLHALFNGPPLLTESDYQLLFPEPLSTLYRDPNAFFSTSMVKQIAETVENEGEGDISFEDMCFAYVQATLRVCVICAFYLRVTQDEQQAAQLCSAVLRQLEGYETWRSTTFRKITRRYFEEESIFQGPNGRAEPLLLTATMDRKSASALFLLHSNILLTLERFPNNLTLLEAHRRCTGMVDEQISRLFSLATVCLEYRNYNKTATIFDGYYGLDIALRGLDLLPLSYLLNWVRKQNPAKQKETEQYDLSITRKELLTLESTAS